MTRDVVDTVIFFAVGLPVQILTYRLQGGRWRDIYGKWWNPPGQIATLAAILTGFLAAWLGHLLFP